MRKPNLIIVLLFIQNIWPILGPVSGYKNWMIFLADISQKVRNIHRANVLRILAKSFLVYFRPLGLEKRLIDCLLPCNFVPIQLIILSINLVSKSIFNSNRTEWSPVIIRVINKISGRSICLITSMITFRIGGHEGLPPFNHNFNKICDI